MPRSLSLHGTLYRSAEDPADSRYDLAVAAIVDRTPYRLHESAPLSAAIDHLLAGHPWGVPILGADGRYRGCCTLRSIASLCLLVNGETAALLPTLRFLHDDIDRIRRHLAASLTKPIVHFLDPFVPTLGPNTTLPEVFFHLYRNNPLLPLVDNEDQRLLGVITANSALRAALGAVDAAAHG